MFKFIGSIFHEMRLTRWPDRHQGWHDFVMVVEYTIFFLAFLMFFDWAIQGGFNQLMKLLLPFTRRL